jgi:hypothetical protein
MVTTMNAQIHKPEWQRIEIWLLWAAVFATMLLFLASRTSDIEHVVTVDSAEKSMPAGERVPRLDDLPFKAADVVQFFSKRLEVPAEKGAEGAAVFENHRAAAAADHWRVAVREEGKSVVVECPAGSDLGLGLMREFFDSPLFERRESEKLHAMLTRAPADSVTRMPRFTASMVFQQAAGLQILTLRLLPNGVR